MLFSVNVSDNLFMTSRKPFYLIVILFLSSCQSNKGLWKGIEHYESNSYDINRDSFLKIVFATYEDDSTFYLLVQDRLRKINYNEQGGFNDTLKEYIFHPLPDYKVTIVQPEKQDPICRINDVLSFRMNSASNKYKRQHIPWGRLGYPFKGDGKGRKKRL